MRACRVLSQGAPARAERSLRFLVTTLAALAQALSRNSAGGGSACLEASVLEAAFQVAAKKHTCSVTYPDRVFLANAVEHTTVVCSAPRCLPSPVSKCL